MNKQTAKELKKELEILNQRITLFNGRLDLQENLGVLYNKMLIERAEISKKLLENNENFLTKLAEKIQFKKKPCEVKLICDYFKN